MVGHGAKWNDTVGTLTDRRPETCVEGSGWWSFAGGEPRFNLFEQFAHPDDLREKIYPGNAELLFGKAVEK